MRQEIEHVCCIDHDDVGCLRRRGQQLGPVLRLPLRVRVLRGGLLRRRLLRRCVLRPVRVRAGLLPGRVLCSARFVVLLEVIALRRPDCPP